ncbi:MAG: uroporphyrinogen decarboxylase family protein [Thermodesulfovibrionales bacterium]
MSEPFSMNPLIDALLAGDHIGAVSEAKKLIESGAGAEEIVTKGIEVAMESMDEKCTIEEFNLLEIMLVGRAVSMVTKELFPSGQPEGKGKGTVVVAALEGDVHDLGKNILKMVLSSRGYHVVDCGIDCPLERLVQVVEKESAAAVYVSGLITSIVQQVKAIRDALSAKGLSHVRVAAGGAALKQASPEALNVDFVAQTAFDGVRYLDEITASRSKMLSIERAVAAVGFQKHDRVPVIPQVLGHAAILSKVPLREYLTNGEILAQCQINALERYGYDAVFAIMDSFVEAEAIGSPLIYREGLYPSISRYILTGNNDFTALPVPDPLRDGRMPELLRAARILRQEVGKDRLVVGCVLGPMTLATQLMGMEKALFLSVDDPGSFEKILDYCTKVITRFGVSQIEAGVHLPLILDQAASPEIVSPDFFRTTLLPRLTTAFSAFVKAGAAANLLNIPGKTGSILPFYPEAGVHIAVFDYPVKPEDAGKALPGTCLFGNIKPFSFMEASPEEMAAEATALLNTFKDRGGFILSSGCEVPLETKPENLDALVASVRR